MHMQFSAKCNSQMSCLSALLLLWHPCSIWSVHNPGLKLTTVLGVLNSEEISEEDPLDPVDPTDIFEEIFLITSSLEIFAF